GKGGGAGADGDGPGHTRELPARHHFPQFLRDTHGLVGVGLSEQNSEFLASVAADHVNLPQLLVKQGGNLSQYLIAQHVSELVVQPLELVDVRHDDGHTRTVAACALNLFHDAQFEKAPVENAGQTVQVGKLF